MNGANGATLSAAATAFDRIASSYDELFTRSMIGRAQRNQVWAKLLDVFPLGSRILELNCGTGIDAMYLALRDRSVVGCDASQAMLEIARRHNREERMPANPEYFQIANEDLDLLSTHDPFDGAFSNFSGLNCLADLQPVASSLAALVKPGGRVVLCLWSRVCLAEIFWYLFHGQRRKAFRRLSGNSTAKLGDITIPVSYPTVSAVRRMFSPWFLFKSHSAVGLFVPPSYCEQWIGRHQKTFAILERLDQLCAKWPLLRDAGDHVLLEFARCS